MAILTSNRLEKAKKKKLDFRICVGDNKRNLKEIDPNLSGGPQLDPPPLVQVQGSSQSKPQGKANVHVAFRERRLQVQKL
ncbi:hypothetical protein RUM44_004781 [Polyplax serrata]|uniref:Uncharacterized protein n=1 Tax=Polyplax serrata TaxID=468196 RepID=A0ABR1B5J8_POLSC